nr:dihydrofolate reductase [uncultured bacterium]
MVTIVAAVAANRTIGKDGQLVWRNKEDMAHFKELTTGKVVIMGRKTWESIPPKFRPLPDRINVVVTRNRNYELPNNVTGAASVEDALRRYHANDVMIIGGAEIYAAAMGRADCLELTEVAAELDGDTFFPEVDKATWKETARTEKEGFAFVTYRRR